MSRYADRQIALACLDRVGLVDRAYARADQLSGGQQQRVAIARALVNNPALILADEPTGTLDSKTGLEIMTLFDRLNQTGITIVIVTHDESVASFARRVISLRDGFLIEDRALDAPTDAADAPLRIASRASA